jgi:hypothetical protein
MPQTSEYVCICSSTKDPVNNCHQDYKLLQEEKYTSQEDMISERTPQQYISEIKETYLHEVNWPVNTFQKPSACSSNTGKSTNTYSFFPASKIPYNICQHEINEKNLLSACKHFIIVK